MTLKKLLIKETSREFIEELDKLIERNGLYVSTKVESYIPAQYKTSKLENEDDLYLAMINLADYISGMTDTFALSLYKKLKGIDMPVIDNILVDDEYRGDSGK